MGRIRRVKGEITEEERKIDKSEEEKQGRKGVPKESKRGNRKKTEGA